MNGYYLLIGLNSKEVKIKEYNKIFIEELNINTNKVLVLI